MVGTGNRTKSSKVWAYFTRHDDGGKCNMCNLLVKGKGGNTSNLEKHLRLKHNVILKRCTLFDTEPTKNATQTGRHTYIIFIFCFCVGTLFN